MPHRVFSDREESCFDALRRECREHGRSIARPRSVVEGQHNLAHFQEIMRLEMLEAEAGSAGGIYFHDAGQSKRVRIPRAGRTQRARGDILFGQLSGQGGAGGSGKRNRRHRCRAILGFGRRGDRARNYGGRHHVGLGDFRPCNLPRWLLTSQRPAGAIAHHSRG